MMATRERPRQRQNDDLEDDAFLVYESAFDLDEDITDEDIEDFLAEQAEADEQSTKKPGFWNLQTGSGLALIGIGAVYLLQQLGFLGLGGLRLAPFIAMLPWLAGILIILTGFGVLSWSPSRRRKRARQRARERRARQAQHRQTKTVGADARRSSRSSTTSRQGASAFDRARQSAERAARGAASSASRTAERISARRTGGKRKLSKRRNNKVIAGVASGIADYFGIDPLLIRIAFVIGAIAGSGAAIFLYIILAFVLPKDDGKGPDADLDDYVRVVRD